MNGINANFEKHIKPEDMARRKADPEAKHQRMLAAIMKIFQENAGQAFNYKQMTELLGLKSKGDRLDVQDMLFEMADAGMVEETTAGRYKVPALRESMRVEGVVDMTSRGYAYIIPDNKAETGADDIFVSQKNLNTALHGDKVEVAIFARQAGKQPEGEVVNIIRRKRETFVGRLQVQKGLAFLVCDPRTTGGHDIYIPIEALKGAKDGQKAIAKIVSWPSNAKNPEGEIVDVLGDAGDNQTEMHAILAEFGLPYHYPEDVDLAAESIDPGITPEEVAKRIDMRGVTTFTIDPVDAKDFDDALSIRKLSNGHWEIGIHIADVTHYVTEGGLIDQEGFSRATSVYLVDRVVPMLPERLSNFVCSLRPDEDKLTYSVIVEMNDEAEVLKSTISKTVIRSCHRFTYEDAQAIIEGADGPLRDEILTMNRLAQKLKAKRFENGAISFERVEVRFRIDDNGKPLSVYFKEAKESNNLVEEFMLLANRRVAEFIGKDELNKGTRKRTPKTFVYRVHDKPNEEKFNKFATFVRRFGYEASPKKGEEINNAVNRILKEVKGKGEQNLVEVLAVRTMAKAIYTTTNIGHYGLAFDYYTHFTSPIRRYPDMMVHRLLHSYLNGGKSVNKNKYEELCEHCSQQEVMAADAERASIKYKQVEFLKDRVGEEFDAVISGVTEWGVYAEIVENKCEGMISLRDFEDDSYYFDEDNYCIVGRNTNRKYQLGDPIRIRIANANLEKKQLDYVLAGSKLKEIERQNAGGASRQAAPKKGKDKSAGMPPKGFLKKKGHGNKKDKKKGGKRRK